MTIKAPKFNPEVLLSAPRRSPGKPNSDGTQVLYSISTYSFSKHERKQEIRLLHADANKDSRDLSVEASPVITQSFSTNEYGFVRAVEREVLGGDHGAHLLDQSAVICDGEGVSGFDWLDDRLIYVCTSDKEKPGATELWIGEACNFDHTKYRAGSIDAEIDESKVKELEEGQYIFAFAAKTTPDGKLFNAEKAAKPHTSGRLYNELFIRHWDQYVTKERNAIWYGTLSCRKDAQSNSDDTKYLLSSVTNALKDTGLECPFYQPTGSDVLWDIGPTGLVFVAKDPTLIKAVYTKQDLYVCATDKQAKDTFSLKKPYKVTLSGFQGATSNPVISPDGVSVAFFSKERKMDEADKNQIWIMPDIHNPQWLHYMYGTFDLRGAWDASPSAMIWGSGQDTFDSSLMLVAESWGSHGIYEIPNVCKLRYEDDLNIKTPLPLPGLVWLSGAISDMQFVGRKDGPKSLFVSAANFRDGSLYYRLSHPSDQLSVWHGSRGTIQRHDVSSLSRYGKLYGLQNVQFRHFASSGATKAIDSWMILPSHFDSSLKYPLALIVHGGPQGAWTDSWSTRWNPAVFAEQGYVVVCPNPTGSTGYGQKFTDDVRGNFGGSPYIDLFNLMVDLEANCPYIDMERAVALGASYGGYMMNYFQGMPIASMFKALVTHDGIFSCVNHLSTDELFFVLEDMGGVYWDSSPPAQKKDPATTSQIPLPSSTRPDAQTTLNSTKYGLLTSDLDISGLSPWHRWDPAHPTRLARGWKTPHLIIHSDKDYRLPMTEGLSAFNVLQMKGTKSRLLNFPDENHWVLKPENSLLWHKVVLDWINEAVGLPGWKNEAAEKLVEVVGMN